MADDMIMNFDFDNVEAAAPQVTFKGGRWRDRKRAQREYNKKHNPGDDNDSTVNTQKRPRADGGDSDRPHKRAHGGDEAAQQRWPSGGGGGDRAPAGRPQNGVTSRLFTSIPTHTTDFEEADAAAAAAAATASDEPVHASNAPLSEEAHSFLKLGLSRRIARQLSEYMGLKAPTAIQKNAILQLVGSDDDAFLQAETGSGKTLAYLLPIVQRLLALSEDNDGKRRPLQVSRDGLGLLAVVLAPTRELCVQISTVLDKLLGCARFLQSTTVLGGEKKKAEKARLRKGTNILVATPGRLTDHLDNTEVLDLSRVRWLVLDEGDRLMEMGFEKDIRAIVSKIRAGRNADDMVTTTKDGQPIPAGILPARRVTVLCSATMKMNAIKLGELTLEEAVHIRSTDNDAASKATTTTTTTSTNDAGETVTTTTTTTDDPAKAADTGAMFDAPSQLKQTYAIVPGKLRLVTLIGLLRSTFARKDKVMKAIIFLSCADSVDYHFDLLRQFGDDGKPVALPLANADPETPPPPPPTSSDTIAPAAYITSAANRAIVLHKLHGSLHQPVRKATLASFRNENSRPTLLITTDIASRGLDVPEVDLVIEYDPAMAVEDHMHRIGRTARAGRSGNTTLFVQPGTEEGYIAFLKSKSSANSQSVLTPQLYDTILKKGYAAPVDLPEGFTMGHTGGIAEPALPTWTGANTTFPAIPAEHDPSQPMQSWTKRAEALQLHIEQRLLKSAAAAGVDPKDGRSSRNAKAKDKKKDPRFSKPAPAAASSHNLLDSARQAFRSHIRAYATHTHEERVYFDMTQLHLGHMAKAFGLREAPGHMGGSIGRLTKPAPKQKTRNNTRDGKDSRGKERTGTRVSMPAPRRHGDDSDDDFAAASVDDAEARRRMQIKMREMMSNPASEFNIG